jgi:hypothetical protein
MTFYMETVNVNLAHRWFIGYDLMEAVPDHSIKVQANSAIDRLMPCVECEAHQRSQAAELLLSSPYA